MVFFLKMENIKNLPLPRIFGLILYTNEYTEDWYCKLFCCTCCENSMKKGREFVKYKYWGAVKNIYEKIFKPDNNGNCREPKCAGCDLILNPVFKEGYTYAVWYGDERAQYVLGLESSEDSSDYIEYDD